MSPGLTVCCNAPMTKNSCKCAAVCSACGKPAITKETH